jgi:hypothetical protein
MNKTFPDGHFYSPVPSVAEVIKNKEKIWEPKRSTVGIDYNESSHINILKNIYPNYIEKYDYEDEGLSDEELTFFYNKNSQFSWLDSRTLFVFLHHIKPRKIIEIGSGYSTLLMSDVNKRFLNSSINITSVEPYPRSFLHNNDLNINLKNNFVQDLDEDFFKSLGENDILFIDSSHISKIGSDVNHLYLNILPSLNSGVIVHIHDIFLPQEYKKEWFDDGIFFNEQYLVQLMLSFSNRYEVIFSSNYAFINHPNLVADALSVNESNIYGGGSIWLKIK